MYLLVPSKRFSKQIRKLEKLNPLLLKKLERAIETLRLEGSLPVAKKDHRLTGRLIDFRECHVAPDWLLIYRQQEDLLILELLAMWSHSTLFE
jgi:mRNA interferase YafQ